MLSRETIEVYRRMTPEERLNLTLQASREGLPYLLQGLPEVVARRFERIRQEHDAGNRALLEGLARARDAEALRGAGTSEPPAGQRAVRTDGGPFESAPLSR